jgi:hypothetical protein
MFLFPPFCDFFYLIFLSFLIYVQFERNERESRKYRIEPFSVFITPDAKSKLFFLLKKLV